MYVLYIYIYIYIYIIYISDYKSDISVYSWYISKIANDLIRLINDQ